MNREGLQEPQALCGWGAWLDGTANASELSEPSLSRTSLLMLTSLNQNGVWPDNPVGFWGYANNRATGGEAEPKPSSALMQNTVSLYISMSNHGRPNAREAQWYVGKGNSESECRSVTERIRIDLIAMYGREPHHPTRKCADFRYGNILQDNF